MFETTTANMTNFDWRATTYRYPLYASFCDLVCLTTAFGSAENPSHQEQELIDLSSGRPKAVPDGSTHPTRCAHPPQELRATAAPQY
jgi:hypothetical protein